MAAEMLSDKLLESLWKPSMACAITSARILLVGAGGIGCEVIKNLMLIGFRDVEMIDLDTIDVSNLNRQFLFNKSHVGQAKSEVAASVAVDLFGHRFPGEKEPIKVKSLQGAIQNPEYNIDWYKSFTLVINALDNIAARSHVNRMCLAANVPLIESGSRGYFAQMYVIRKGISQCYDCAGPRKEEKSFASCTIRNTPSLPIHCIVWAKHLFAQLFGEEDPDHDVSPDMNDPTLAEQNNSEVTTTAPEKSSDELKNTKPPSTREWAKSVSYNATSLFEKFFTHDIEYLLKMDKLWENRQRPIPLKLSDLLDGVYDTVGSVNNGSNGSNGKSKDHTPVDSGLKDQSDWPVVTCYEKFVSSISSLYDRLQKCGEKEYLVWDKDDEQALDFVTAVSNLRSICFSIPRKSRFEVKSLAGNIVPAISSTNSIVGGLVAQQALNIIRMNNEIREIEQNLSGDELELRKKEIFHKFCRQSALRSVKLPSVILSCENFPPSESCIICSSKTPEITISLSLASTSMSDFVDEILIKQLNFVSPEVINGSSILWSKDDIDEEEDAALVKELKEKKMNQFPMVVDGLRLKIDDLVQNHSIMVTLRDETVNPVENDGLFYKLEIMSGTLEKEKEVDQDEELKKGSPNDTNGGGEVSTEEAVSSAKKRQATEELSEQFEPTKKMRQDTEVEIETID